MKFAFWILSVFVAKRWGTNRFDNTHITAKAKHYAVDGHSIRRINDPDLDVSIRRFHKDFYCLKKLSLKNPVSV